MQLAPSWSHSGRLLANALARGGEAAQAVALLERAVATDPLDPQNHGVLAQHHLRLGEKDKAAEGLERAAALDPDYGWAWDVLLEVDADRAEASARTLTAARPGEAMAHWRLASVLSDRRLDAAEKAARLAVERGPWHLQSWDLLAWILWRQGRTAEAEALCAPERWSGTVPTVLVRRRALILAGSGRAPAAIEALQAHLAREPADEVAWNQLRWAAGLAKRTELVEQCLQRLRQLQPSESWVHREAGRRLRQDGRAEDRTRALQAWEAVARLEPHDVEAACALADLHRQGGDKARALAAIAACRRLRPSPWLTAYQASLAVDQAEAYRHFAELCRDASAGEDEVLWLSNELDGAHGGPRWRAALEALLAEPPAAVAGAVLAARHLFAERGVAGALRWLAARPPDCAFSTRLLAWLVEACAERGDVSGVLRLYSEQHARAADDAFTWGEFGYALSTIRAWPTMSRWARSWRRLSGCQGWMLANAATALRVAGSGEANAVSRHALETCDDCRGIHASWLAFDAAFADDAEAMRRWRDVTVQDELSLYDRIPLELAEALARPGFADALAALEAVVERRSPMLGQASAAAMRCALAQTAAAVLARATGPWQGLRVLHARLTGSLRPPAAGDWGNGLKLWWARQRGWG